MLKRCVMVALLALSQAAWAQFYVQDSLGRQTLDKRPERVIALSWELAEQVLELDVVPLAISDIPGYSEWVRQPAMPEQVIDLGTRAEPNLERIAELKPDVIFASLGQRHLIPALSQIAPVLYYSTYQAGHDNVQAAIDNYRRIAHVLGQSELAERKLSAMEQRIAALSAELTRAFPAGKPLAVSLRFANPTAAWVYGKNSIPEYVLERLGFEPALDSRASQWGISQQKVLQLARVEQGLVLYFEPFYYQAEMDRSRLWQAMPFVKQGRIAPVAPTWSYGGAMSILYNAEALAATLFALAPQVQPEPEVAP
ncbi:iron-siderophore ABC transporter substrate-binding protein [Aliagarivorans marinus]|uniref:iron-siderophore ABC transporter substrate-binding protein n=1 Tax=Aliagarivorans marinus TaxID=561965 RepID=UPI0004072140|nr:iron-siderophore ABC transporter substrate-binding protein [Aliagarivorans marinus]